MRALVGRYFTFAGRFVHLEISDLPRSISQARETCTGIIVTNIFNIFIVTYGQNDELHSDIINPSQVAAGNSFLGLQVKAILDDNQVHENIHEICSFVYLIS